MKKGRKSWKAMKKVKKGQKREKPELSVLNYRVRGGWKLRDEKSMHTPDRSKKSVEIDITTWTPLTPLDTPRNR